MANTLFTIHPYRHGGIWVFDDEVVGLVREPFVSGADKIIDHFAGQLPHAEEGFDLIFSAAPFPGYEAALLWQREDCGGNWYTLAGTPMEGWLCPALFCYFDEAPQQLYAQFVASER